MEQVERDYDEDFGFEEWDGELVPDQEDCKNDVVECMMDGRFPIITSIMGAGKTVIVAKAASEYQADRIIVISPVGAIQKWRDALDKLFDKSMIQIFSYDGLKGGKGAYVKINDDNEYYVTKEWEELVQRERVVVILDEFHRLQKITLQSRAVAALTRSVSEESRVICISYTPCDIRADFVNFAYALGYINEYDPQKIKSEHLLELVENAFNIPKDQLAILKRKAVTITGRRGKLANSSKLEFIATVYIKYIIPHVTFFSTPEYTLKQELTPDYGNLMYEVDQETAIKIQNVFSSAIQVNGGVTRVLKKDKKTVMTIAKEIEAIKAPIYAKIAREYLQTTPNVKIIIMVLRLDTISYMEEELKEFGVTTMRGKMKIPEREASNRIFQEDSDRKNVMVGTLQTLKESLDLHDTTKGGKRPRKLLMPFCYYTKAIIQGLGRVYRNGLQSPPTIRLVCTTFQGKSLEKKYYDSVKTKSREIGLSHLKEQKSFLPCDYPDVHT